MGGSRHRLAIAIAMVVSAFVLVRSGRAQAPAEPALPVTIAVTTIGECPADRFRTALASRVRRPFEVTDNAVATLRLTIASRTPSALEGTASFKGASGEATRSVRGSCEEITSALALIAATWLEAEPTREAPAVDAGIPPATTEAIDASTPTDASVAPPEAASSAAAPTVAPPPPPAAPTEPATPKELLLGAHGVATFGIVGNPSFGADLALAYETERFEFRGGVRGALSSDTIASGRAHYAWLTVPIDGCGHALASRALRLAGCIRLEPGYFNVSFASVDRSLFWFGAGAVARLGWSLGPLRLEVEGSANLPITGYRVTRTDVSLVPFRAFAPGVAAGLMVPFW